MIRTIIKRNGTKEPYIAEKINGWGIWASENLKGVDWSEVVLNTVSSLPFEVTSTELQKALIDYCLSKKTWDYNRMAGRLYTALIVREIHGSDAYPTVKELHQRLQEYALMEKLDYSDEEYEHIEKIIKHKNNLKLPQYALNQNRWKYALRDKVNGIEFETTQFIYMRMSMTICEETDKSKRMQEIEELYDEFTNQRINVPTPYYVNLGTNLKGFASCNTMTTLDTAKSLATGDHIAYMMTVASAGIGYHLKTRSIGDPIKNGLIKHQGKVPYIRANIGAVGANLQNGRGGATTIYFNAYDPEIETLMKLKNPNTPLAKQARGADYSVGFNGFIIKKAIANQEIALFSYKDAPKLYELMYSDDTKAFEKEYQKFIDSDLPRTMVSARKIVGDMLAESFDTGRVYEHFTDIINTHTPFKDKIYQSNLCMTGDQYVISNYGLKTVKELYDMGCELELFDGKKVVKSSPMKLRERNQDVYKITLKNGMTHTVTDYHKVMTDKGLVECKNLNIGDKVSINRMDSGLLDKSLIEKDIVGKYGIEYAQILLNAFGLHYIIDDWVLTESDELLNDIVSIEYVGKEDVYCPTVESDEHLFVANGFITSNCAEIALPTYGFTDVPQLYSEHDESLNFTKIVTEKGEFLLNNYIYVKLADGTEKLSQRLYDCDETVEYGTIQSIETSHSPEIGLCNIGGIVVSNIKNDEQYAKTAYWVLRLIRYGILNSEYVFKNLEQTAKARMSAGVGIVGLAHLMAKNKLSYSSQEGKNFIHELAETHAWHLYNASLKIGQDFGNAEWMYKTKWVDGWTPIKTYNKNVDKLVTVGNKRDWDDLSRRIAENNGMAFSVCVAHMPAESCMDIDTKIKTENGVMSLKEIFALTGRDIEKDLLEMNRSMDGGKWFKLDKPINVYTLAGLKPLTDVWLNGVANYIEIELENGDVMRVTHHHKFLVRAENGKTSWKMAIDLNENDDIVNVNEPLEQVA